jgi:hypothetical protein
MRWVDTVTLETTGQGIAWDRSAAEPTLYGIVRGGTDEQNMVTSHRVPLREQQQQQRAARWGERPAAVPSGLGRRPGQALRVATTSNAGRTARAARRGRTRHFPYGRVIRSLVTASLRMEVAWASPVLRVAVARVALSQPCRKRDTFGRAASR